MASSDLEACDAAWRYPETVARQIRNALTHTVPFPGGVPLAVPSGALIELRQVVSSRLGHQPPPIGAVAAPAHRVPADMPVHAALQDLLERDFSQAPYRADGSGYRMFTSEQVARRPALQDGSSDLGGVTVAEVSAFGPADHPHHGGALRTRVEEEA
jgi:hypothetical protein